MVLSKEVPLIIDRFGNWTQPNLDFAVERQVFGSCSVTFNNEMYVYGRNDHKRQVSMIIGCALTKVAELTFDHYFGACAVGDQEIFLCFSVTDDDNKKCRKSRNPEKNFQEVSRSNHQHRYTRIAASKSKL